MAMVRKIPASIIDIKSYSDNVRRFRLQPQKKGIKFKAGQFLHLAIEPYDPSFDWPESRVFSIANSPTRTNHIDILVSKIGKFTSEMFQKLKVGDEIWIKLPYGDFNFNESLEHDTILVAGGTGISPFISFLQYSIDKQLNPAIHLNYGIRNTDLLIIGDLLEEAEQKLSNFYYKIYVEDFKRGKSKYNLYPGKLPVNEIVHESLELNDSVIYLSGPPGMILTFDKELKKSGVNPKLIKYDDWE
jgi:ferredoxin-NADP reductase